MQIPDPFEPAVGPAPSMKRAGARPRAAAGPLGLTLAAGLSAACGAERFDADRFLDEAVAVGSASAVVLDVPVPVNIRGATGSAQVTVTGTITVSTSSAARSRAFADALEVRVERVGSNLTVGLQVPGSGAGTPFPEATLRGILEVSLPGELPLQVFQRGGSVRVGGMAAELDIRSVGPVQVQDARASVSVRCDNGPVEVATRASPGTRTFVGMVGGEARVILPGQPNARILAATENGQIFLSHPQLPPGPADPYDVVVGAALAELEVSVRRGNIVFLAR